MHEPCPCKIYGISTTFAYYLLVTHACLPPEGICVGLSFWTSKGAAIIVLLKMVLMPSIVLSLLRMCVRIVIMIQYHCLVSLILLRKGVWTITGI